MILSMLMPQNLAKFTEWTLRESIETFHLSKLGWRGGEEITSCPRGAAILLKTPWIGYCHCMLR